MNDFPKEKGLSRALNVEMKKKEEVQLHPGLLRFYSSTLQLQLKPDFFFLILSISKSSMLSKYSLIIYQHH